MAKPAHADNPASPVPGGAGASAGVPRRAAFQENSGRTPYRNVVAFVRLKCTTNSRPPVKPTSKFGQGSRRNGAGMGQGVEGSHLCYTCRINKERDSVRRIDGRSNSDMRPVRITTSAQAFAEGSALIEFGQTKVLCAVSMEDRVPPFLKGSGQGWVTAEYAMLPRSTATRTPRESNTKPSGRSLEIQRLIGRSIRAV